MRTRAAHGGLVRIASRPVLAVLGLLGLVGALVLSPAVVAHHLLGDVALSPVGIRLVLAARLVLASAAVLLLIPLSVDLPAPALRRLAVFCVPLLFLLSLLVYKGYFGLRDGLYIEVIREDSVAEYVTFLLLVLAALVFAVAAGRLLRPQLFTEAALSVLFAAAMLFIALEEVSYGQRILGFGTPEQMLRINRQKEFSLHNISALEDLTLRVAPVVVGLCGVFGFLVWRLVGRTIGGLLPWLRNLGLFVPPAYAASYFLPLALYSFTIFHLGEHFVWEDQEAAELFMAAGLLLTALHAAGGVRSLEIERRHPSPRGREGEQPVWNGAEYPIRSFRREASATQGPDCDPPAGLAGRHAGPLPRRRPPGRVAARSSRPDGQA